MYADDVKLRQQYNEHAQSLALQSNLEAFQIWYSEIKINLNGLGAK